MNTDPTIKVRRHFDIIDAVAILSRYLKWIIIIPLISALVTLLISLYLPKTYTSEASLLLDDAAAHRAEVLIRSTPTVNAALRAASGLNIGTGPDAVDWVRRRIQIEPAYGGRRNNAVLFNFQFRDSDPARAQATATAILEGWIETAKPRPEERARLTQDLSRLRAEQKLADDLIVKVQTESRQSNPMLDPATTLPALLARRDNLNQSIVRTEKELAGISRDVVLTAPTLPSHADPLGTRKLMFWAASIAGAAITALVLLIGYLSEFRPDIIARLRKIRT